MLFCVGIRYSPHNIGVADDLLPVHYSTGKYFSIDLFEKNVFGGS